MKQQQSITARIFLIVVSKIRFKKNDFERYKTSGYVFDASVGEDVER